MPAKKEPAKAKTVFERLSQIDVTKHIEKKKDLSYLTWSWAWAETKKVCPDVTYKIWRDENGNPYTYDEVLGYMCYTEVTIEGETLPMWLPVMDSSNKSMKKVVWKYEVQEWKNGRRTGKMIEKTVQPATTFDINKTIMRCLVKNIAMFGMGLYIYAGEDLPEEVEAVVVPKKPAGPPTLNQKFYDAGVKAIESKDENRISKLSLFLSKVDDSNKLKGKLVEMLLDFEVEKENKKEVKKVSTTEDSDKIPPPPIPDLSEDNFSEPPY